MKNKILVTGGFGFLGSHVVTRLREIFPDGNILAFSRRNGIDFRDEKTVVSLLQKEKPNLIVHCAARVGGIAYNQLHPTEVFEDNTLIGLSLIRACGEVGVSRIINVMPNCTYPGDQEEYEESQWWHGPMHPSVLTYGLPRKMLWGHCSAYCQKNPDFKPVHLILPNMYGPGDHFDSTRSHALGALIAKIVNAEKNHETNVEIWGTGKPVREWLYVEDGAEAIVQVSKNWEGFCPNEIMNIGVTKGISILELAEMIRNVVGWKGRFILQPEKMDGATKKILVSKKMRQKLNWFPSTSLKDGIQKTVQWYQNQSSSGKHV